jgi:hypothetical protein
MAKPATRDEILAIKTGYANRFLSAVLERVEAQSGRGRSFLSIDGTKNTAFFAKFVAINVQKRVCYVDRRTVRFAAPLVDRQVAMLRINYKG